LGYAAGDYDVIVIGAGHAGCEAGLAAARMGVRTLILTMNLDAVALMPCNPAIGGPAKGHLVREIDALGGEMGVNCDKSFVQIRMLNTGKGPAVRALRAQADKKKYQIEMRATVETQDNLEIKQATVEAILVEGYRVRGVVTTTGAMFRARAVVVTTGTYLRGRIIIGDLVFDGGPNGQFPSVGLAKCLRELGFRLERFKTGTPPRIHGGSVDFSRLEVQPGDDKLFMFSFLSEPRRIEQMPCWLTYTNTRTHEIIRENLHRAPLFSGLIEGTGPRYCPSIEDKILRFAEKAQHQVFLEPEGRKTCEIYVQGMSTSLPEDVQLEMLRSMKGLEKVQMMRPGYAIEYDCLVASQLKLTLETKEIAGLYTAGQLNGTSGYEEAAAQGLIAGVNAVLGLKGEEPLILKRFEAYVGVLIDDIVTKGVNEPYRMLTSRAEYRLLLRHDNADLRLTEIGAKVGLVSDDRLKRFKERQRGIEDALEEINSRAVGPGESKLQEMLSEVGTAELKGGARVADILRRPEVRIQDLIDIGVVSDMKADVSEEVEIILKYSGYIEKQKQQVERFERLEGKTIPADISFRNVSGLSSEAKQKLEEIRPQSIGQAARISGVSPADIAVLLVELEKKRRRGC